MSKTPSPLTFEETDRLDLKAYCKRLESFLLVESDFVESSLVVALNASFGRGKTTFIEMWKNDLLKRRSSPNGDALEVPMPVILNAWESDYCGDPLVAILAGLLKAVDAMQGKSKSDETKAKKIKEAAQNLGWMLAGVGSGFTSKLTGVNPLEVANLMDAKKAERNPAPPDFIQLFNHRQKALEDLREALAEAFAGYSPKVLVFVDELDRCRPDYAINYLETIKHVFNIKGMIFLLAIDAHQLEVSAKALFGDGLDFPEYFRKFCHRVFELPMPERTPLALFLEHQISLYVQVLEKRNSRLKADSQFITNATQLAQGFNLTLRQLQEVFRVLGHALSTQDQNSIENMRPSAGRAALMLAIFRISFPSLYLQIGHSQTDHAPLCRELYARLGARNARSWIILYLSGLVDEDQEKKDFKAILKDVGDESYQSELLDSVQRASYDLWSHHEGVLILIWNKMQSIESI
ncbi:hypothetical protein GCM10023213_48440 [Prosthecobacter algae]|uniref:KAP NTPase domain-containing protein n=1 Tax=Prosthecobacter algae TaxID=1144682 RepID=A0ABP9PTL0_9BACT